MLHSSNYIDMHSVLISFREEFGSLTSPTARVTAELHPLRPDKLRGQPLS